MPSKYNDSWIIENYENYSSWSEMLKDYNLIFGTNFTRAGFKGRCHDLGLKLGKYFYTEEQNKWLVENYPRMMTDQLTELFNERFHTNKSEHSIKVHCTCDLKVFKTEELREQIKQYCNKYLLEYVEQRKCEIGCVGNPVNGYLQCKQDDGTWVYYARHLYEQTHGTIPYGYSIVFLDGDKRNFNINNLAAIPTKYQAIINSYFKISGDKDLMETAIKWCELYQLF